MLKTPGSNIIAGAFRAGLKPFNEKRSIKKSSASLSPDDISPARAQNMGAADSENL